jgi:Uma2 family endonuclease
MLGKREVIYLDADGKPMSDNTKQARWIFIFFGNLLALYRAVADVFVAADNLWYPVEGEDTVRMAPDVYVVFGRPKGDRGSYKQWEEGGIPLTVVFEVWSPGNDAWEMEDKRLFYEEHGVEEYFLYDPDRDRLEAYVRGKMGGSLVRQRFKGTFTSPRLGIRFDITGPEMRVFYPNGEPFLGFDELKEAQERERALRLKAEAKLADEQALRQDAESRASTAEKRLARMSELSRKARKGQASHEELAELEQLEGPA